MFQVNSEAQCCGRGGSQPKRRCRRPSSESEPTAVQLCSVEAEGHTQHGQEKGETDPARERAHLPFPLLREEHRPQDHTLHHRVAISFFDTHYENVIYQKKR